MEGRLEMLQQFTPVQYVKIDIANNFGLDKLTWDQRLEWFEQNKHQLRALLPKAENMAQFYAGIEAWENMQKGLPIGFTVSLDATSSGIQILSVLTGDKSAAQISNVLDTGKRGNAYRTVYERMTKKVGDEAKLPYAPVKSAVMTSYYGSEKVPREVFGEGPLLQAFHETMEELTPAAWELNKALLERWDPEAEKYSWVMPDRFHVHIKVKDEIEEDITFMGTTHTIQRKVNRPTPEGRSLSANLVHSVDGFIVREIQRRCNYDRDQLRYVRQLLVEGPGAAAGEPSEKTEMLLKLWELYQQSGYLSARIIDFIDSTNVHLIDAEPVHQLIDSMPPKPFKVIPVHDCFRVHPNYGNDIRRQYNLQLYLIAKSNMLEFMLRQILKLDGRIEKLDHFEQEILEANYALS